MLIGIISLLLGGALVYAWFSYQHRTYGQLKEESERLEQERKLLEEQIRLKKNAIFILETDYNIAQEDYNNLKALSQMAETETREFQLRLQTQTETLEQLNNSIRDKTDFINVGISELEKAKKEELAAKLKNETDLTEQQIIEAKEKAKIEIQDWDNKSAAAKDKYFSVIAALSQIEDEAKTHSIQLSKEDIADIEFLNNEVVPRLQNKEVIYKLIWTEYYQDPTKDLLSEILPSTETPGIYKITNLENKKCYIGRSTNVKRRLTDHIKSSIGIETIANQKIHDVMREEGIWNFSFELLEACEKDQLGDREKYYIEFFQSNNSLYGYNVVGGSAFKG